MRIRLVTSALFDIWICLILTSLVLVPYLLAGITVTGNIISIPIFSFLLGHSAVTIVFPYSRAATEQVDFVSTRDTRRDPTGFERLLLSIVFSITYSASILFVMVVYAIGTIEQFPLILSSFYLITGLLAFSRSYFLEEQDRFRYDFQIETPDVSRSSFGSRAIAAALFLSLMYSAPPLIGILENSEQEGFTEFYILNSDQTAGDYQITMAQGSVASVLVGVTNKEGTDLEYSMEVTNYFFGDSTRDGEETSEIAYLTTFQINDDELMIEEYLYSFSEVGLWRIDFDLYKGQEVSNPLPHRNIHLWIDVVQS